MDGAELLREVGGEGGWSRGGAFGKRPVSAFTEKPLLKTISPQSLRRRRRSDDFSDAALNQD